jgi:SAM-dependent methyltransferase
LVARLSLSAGALTVVGAAIDAKVSGTPLDPNIQPHADAVLDALAARGLIDDVSRADLLPVLAEIRLTFLQGAKLLYEATRGSGWTHEDSAILVAAGETSSGFAGVLKQMIAPRLPGLADRLEASSGSFLDVGVGVAGLSIAMARLWPSLSLVGIDRWAPSLAIARENVRAARLTDRIEVRQQAAEDLPDVDAFDLAWVPAAFIPETSIPAIVERVHRALRPGGWLLFAMVNQGGDPLAGSYARLRTATWGGALLAAAQVEALLGRAGFVDVQVLPGPPNAVVAMFAARRT